ncbi:MAG: hypothetical protein IH927_02105 [Proteobacteria bacterium]|nr:hypothetical protein [Pseudomonadota bacterium]
MQYLDIDKLDAIDADAFADMKPYPFINPAGLLTDDGYTRLLENQLDVSLLNPSFGRKRSHGQYSHDRYVLEYQPGLDFIPAAWKDFIAELQGPAYSSFIKRLYRCRSFRLNMHWHYAPGGCGVSPHCDAIHKMGSHIFYLNTLDDWDPSWGGQTLVLDDHGRFDTNSAPAFEDFDNIISSECVGNYSTLFLRRDRSWHGVRELTCPDGKLRKVFIIVINRPLLYAARRALNWLKKKK